ncbi:MAG: amino acid oxidase [Planctomycetes bacterium SCN 63-9]|nr:MAG: amino acid oxidase [Planctomycetes bacterium SCN 63-9]
MARIAAKNVVIGAGAMGSAAAYHLARRGEPVVLLEQFPIGHDRGSSHGLARITRHSYADPAYARLMPDAFRAWRELEAEACESLYVRTGGVTLCPPGNDYVARVTASLEMLDVPHRRLTGHELNRANPAFGVADDVDVVFEPDAGMLCAAKAVRLQVALARQIGGEKTQVLDNTPVRRIDLDGGCPVVVTDVGEFEAERLIVSAGAWLKRLLPDYPVPVQVTRQQVLYFRPPDAAPFQIGRLPVFIFKGDEEGDAFYGMPEFQGLGVKVARHFGPEFDPDLEDRMVDEEYRGVVREFCRRTLPALADAPIDLTETCLYTVAPDEKFEVDFYPGRTDVMVASPCSGHGFKFSCLIGRVLADLASRGGTDTRIDPWRTSPAN